MSEPLYSLALTETEIAALAHVLLPSTVIEKARILVQPLTRTDAGTTTAVDRDGPEVEGVPV